MDAHLARVYARWCSRSVLYLWDDAPELLRQWVDTGDEAQREAAHQLATRRSASRGVMTIMTRDQVVATIISSATTAALSLESVEWSAELAHAWGAPVAESDLLKSAAREAHRSARALITHLAELLPRLGLVALRTPEAERDPWLTREVWRALELPELEVVEARCRWMSAPGSR